MNRGGIARLVRLELRRHLGRLVAAGFGISIAIAALSLFLALGLGVRAVLLGDVFPVDRLEVAPIDRNLDLLALRLQLGSDTLNTEQLEMISDQPGVAAVYPKMKLTVPTLASGGSSLLGTTLQTEVVVDGIDPALVTDEVGDAFEWAEFDPPIPCSRTRDCPENAYCGDGAWGTTGVCRQYVPVLASHHLLEMYNGSLRRAYGLPRVNPDAVVGLRFELAFGGSSIRRSPGYRVVAERARLVGFSDRAIPLGVTLPLELVRRLNVMFGSERAADAYHSAIVQVADRRAIPDVIEAVQGMGLAVKSRGAERATTLLAVLFVLVSILGGAMIVIASVSVAHSFYMIVIARRREFAVFRATGARRSDIRALILAQAAVVGAAAGTIGILAAVIAGTALDRLAGGRIPDFPYKPDSFFQFPGWLLLGAVALAVAASIAGAAVPAIVESRRDPADAFTSP